MAKAATARRRQRPSRGKRGGAEVAKSAEMELGTPYERGERYGTTIDSKYIHTTVCQWEGRTKL